MTDRPQSDPPTDSLATFGDRVPRINELTAISEDVVEHAGSALVLPSSREGGRYNVVPAPRKLCAQISAGNPARCGREDRPLSRRRSRPAGPGSPWRSTPGSWGRGAACGGGARGACLPTTLFADLSQTGDSHSRPTRLASGSGWEVVRHRCVCSVFWTYPKQESLALRSRGHRPGP